MEMSVNEFYKNHKPQIHKKKTKHMLVGLSFSTKNRFTQNLILINNAPVPRMDNWACLGVDVDEILNWEKHADQIRQKVEELE